MVQDRMAQGFGITTGIQEAREGSSGLSSSRLTTVQGNCVARRAPRRPGHGSLSVSDQHSHHCWNAIAPKVHQLARMHRHVSGYGIVPKLVAD